MTKYMIRVVLHDARSDASNRPFDRATAQAGFERELPGKKAVYELPPGDYWYIGKEASVDRLRVKAAAAVRATANDFGIVVVRVDGWSVMGLKKTPIAPQA